MTSTILIVLCIAIGAIVAIVGLFRPFLGLLVFLVIHFVQPSELVPQLAPFRIELVYGALLIFVLFRRRARDPNRIPIFDDKILRGILLLCGAGILSIPFAIWPGGAAATVIEMVKLITLVFLLKLMVDTEDKMRNLLWCLFAIATWFAASSLSAFYHGQYYHLHYNLGNLNRAQGVNSIVGGPNELAGILLSLMPLSIALLRTTKNILARVLLIAGGVISLVAITYAGSRIAIVGLAVIAVYYIFHSKRRVATLIGAVVIAAALWGWMPPEYRARYLTVQEYAEGGRLDDSNQLRLQVWKAGREIFFTDPILGVGAGQFSIGYGLIYLHGAHVAWMQPHNLLIEVACELGIVGLLALVYFLVQLWKGIAQVLREKDNSAVALSYQVGIACAVMFVGVIILSAVSHTLYRPYWYILGGLVAANRGVFLAKLKAATEPAPADPMDDDSPLKKFPAVRPFRPKRTPEPIAVASDKATT